jgi:hypothetical protein
MLCYRRIEILVTVTVKARSSLAGNAAAPRCDNECYFK